MDCSNPTSAGTYHLYRSHSEPSLVFVDFKSFLMDSFIPSQPSFYLLPKKVFSTALAVDTIMSGVKIPIKIQQRTLDQNRFRSGSVSSNHGTSPGSCAVMTKYDPQGIKKLNSIEREDPSKSHTTSIPSTKLATVPAVQKMAIDTNNLTR